MSFRRERASSINCLRIKDLFLLLNLSEALNQIANKDHGFELNIVLEFVVELSNEDLNKFR